MAFNSLNDGRKWKFGILIGTIVAAAIAGVLVILSTPGPEEKQQPYFSKVELVDEKISPGENTLLKAKVSNPGDNTYENVKIKLVAISPKVEMAPTSPKVETERSEYGLTISTPTGLGKGEKTKLYTFNVGGDLYTGLDSMTAIIKARVLADGKVTDNQLFELTISSKEVT